MEKTFARYHCLGGDGSERVFSQFYRFVSLCTITRNSVCKWFLLFCWVLVWFAKSSYGLLRSYPFQPYGISATAGDMSILFSGCLHLQSWCLLTFSNLGVRRTSVKFTGHRSSDDWWPLNIALWIRLLTLWPLLVGFGWVSDVIAIAYFFLIVIFSTMFSVFPLCQDVHIYSSQMMTWISVLLNTCFRMSQTMCRGILSSPVPIHGMLMVLMFLISSCLFRFCNAIWNVANVGFW